MLVSFREHNSEYNSEHKLFATPHAIYMRGMTSLFKAEVNADSSIVSNTSKTTSAMSVDVCEAIFTLEK